LDAVRHIGFDREWMLTILAASADPCCTSLPSGNAQRNYCWFGNFFRLFSGVPNKLTVFRVRWTELHHIWGEQS